MTDEYKDKPIIVLMGIINDSLAGLIIKVLQDEGCTNVTRVIEPDKATQMLMDLETGLLILNNRLPGISGVDYIRSLKQAKIACVVNRKAKILLITGGWIDETTCKADKIMYTSDSHRGNDVIEAIVHETKMLLLSP